MRIRLALLLLAAAPAPLLCQLPLLTAPHGTLRIEFGGAFQPATSEWIDGSKRDIGTRLTYSTIDAAATPLLGDLETRLATLLGRPPAPASLGSIATIAEYQRGTATIGLGYGLTRRLTLFGTIPIVSTRTQRSSTYSADGVTVGANPADAVLGDAGGKVQTEAFFTQFDAALATLQTRFARGDYATDQAKQALAQQTLQSAPQFRDQLFALLADTATMSVVLPTASSADGAALLGAIGALRNTFGNDLGIAGFTGAPALPAAPLTADGFGALLAAPSGFGVLAPEEQPRVGLGDIDLGATYEVLRHGKPGDARWLGLWAQGIGRVRSGTLPRPAYLLDQGTGDRQIDAEFAGIGELGRGRFGLRGEVRATLQLASERFARVAYRDQLLVPRARTAGVKRDPGDVLAITLQPFVRLAPHFAVTGLVQHWRRGEDRTTYVANQAPVAEMRASILDQGTAANATRVGLGLSYVHDGLHRDGILRMPVEAGLSVERTVASSAGIVPASLTSRLVFRVYKAIVRH